MTFDYCPKLDAPKPPIPPPDFKLDTVDVEGAPKRGLLAPEPNNEPPADADALVNPPLELYKEFVFYAILETPI